MQTAVKRIAVILILTLVVSFFNEVMAQCPMCRTAVESAMQNEGNTVGLGLNKGILYLLASPYLLVAIIGTIWYRNNKRAKAAE